MWPISDSSVNWSRSWPDPHDRKNNNKDVTWSTQSYGSKHVDAQWKPVNLWADGNDYEDEEKESQIFNYGFLWNNGCYFYTGRCVWMQSQRKEWWDRDDGMIVMNGFTETDVIQNFRMSRAIFNYICQRLSTRLSQQDTAQNCDECRYRAT